MSLQAVKKAVEALQGEVTALAAHVETLEATHAAQTQTNGQATGSPSEGAGQNESPAQA